MLLLYDSVPPALATLLDEVIYFVAGVGVALDVSGNPGTRPLLPFACSVVAAAAKARSRCTCARRCLDIGLTTPVPTLGVWRHNLLG